MKRYLLALSYFSLLSSLCGAQDMPRLEKQQNRFALVVDGKPFLILGAQLNNSSSWESTLPHAWQTLEEIHTNTVEAPVYWEQLEPTHGNFDFSGVDLLLKGAREHHQRLVLLWFGTWKNGQNHYVPEWMKTDLQTYPREVSSHGKILDVMSPNSPVNMEADKKAFAALMHHVREIDGSQHTVIMIQVENESGSIGTVRDYSMVAQKSFDAMIPLSLAHALNVPQQSWVKTFGADADERFAAWSTAHYVGEVAEAGKREYPLPMYCNVWLTYPVHALENRDMPSAGQEYPSGGPQADNIEIWKAGAPAIDLLAPDVYSDDPAFFHRTLTNYTRSDNALFIPETRLGPDFGRFLFEALGHGAIGFAPFGIDHGGGSSTLSQPTRPGPNWTANGALNFALLGSIAEQLAQLNLQGKLQTAVEEKGSERQTLHFGDTDAVLSFGFPQADGTEPPGTPDRQGRALVAQLGPNEYLLTGFDASINFHSSSSLTARNRQVELLRAEEGTYLQGVWRTTRVLNGDETDRGLRFPATNTAVVRVFLQEIPLLAR